MASASHIRDSITFIFSEAMDPKSVVLPNPDSTNPDRSYEVFSTDDDGVTRPVFPGGLEAVAREGGRMIEIPYSNASTASTGAVYFRIFRNGFRNLKGEPLGRDYLFRIYPCQSCLDPFVRAALPPSTQAESNPTQPISIYFNQGVDPKTLEADLRAPDGSLLTALDFRWDMPFATPGQPPDPSMGYLHLSVEHPPLAPSARPYLLRILKLKSVWSHHDWWPNANLPQEGLRITVGPALAGDLNDDGQVTVADALLTLRGVLLPDILSDAQRFAADLAPSQGTNGRWIGDGEVTISDAVIVLRRSVGAIPDAQWP